ncbi:LacI family DNA-binding transcriptional regulator [Actinotalea fermentans]|uniref:LacI family transcriptional regulator n=1 Tax=Actinotalea fermentans TaxID=43671 RepID=A0A511YZ39_9CELL|nr:LacI family DNA-binding transcriptional regulator [Actinotalea fermentans]GEN80463.1 LacI family transcriptional regulator [Actinotalea fermentans]
MMTLSGVRTHRPTITDVARAAGVSTAVVSYALNGRPGVSAATRERVLRVAEEFGWRPDVAARSVRGGPRTVALVVMDRPGTLARDAGFLDLVEAARGVLAGQGYSLVVQLVDAGEDVAQTYRQWWAERRFDLVVLPDLLADGPRVAATARVRAPAVLLGPCPGPDAPPAVWFDEDQVAVAALSGVAGSGHREVAAVAGPLHLRAPRARADALSRAADALGVRLACRETDATPEGAAAATHALLQGERPPSAVVYDGAAAALAGLEVARRLGVRVPWDLSVVALGDSALCRLASPPVTVVPLSLAQLGAAVGRAVLDVLEGSPEHRYVVPVSGLVLRGSTCPHVARAS